MLRIVLSDKARTGSPGVPSALRLPGFVLVRNARISASISDGRSRSRVSAPNGPGSKCLRHSASYSSRVAGLRSDTASVVARQCFSQSATVCRASVGGVSASSRRRASASLARTSRLDLP
jgi:hypothetical protein